MCLLGLDPARSGLKIFQRIGVCCSIPMLWLTLKSDTLPMFFSISVQKKRRSAAVSRARLAPAGGTKQTFFLTEQLQNVIAQAEADRVPLSEHLASCAASW